MHRKPAFHGTRPLMAVALACAASAAHSVENGAPITPIGIFEFGAGTLPPSSVDATVGVRGASYSASQLRDTRGERSPVGIKLKVHSASLAIVKTTDVPLLGGTYGFTAVVPYLDMSNRLTIPTPVGPMPLKGTNAAVGDITVAPVVVKWTPSPGLFINGRLELQLPTGSYKADRLINSGSNHWTASPAVSCPGNSRASIGPLLSPRINTRSITLRSSRTCPCQGCDSSRSFTLSSMPVMGFFNFAAKRLMKTCASSGTSALRSASAGKRKVNAAKR